MSNSANTPQSDSESVKKVQFDNSNTNYNSTRQKNPGIGNQFRVPNYHVRQNNIGSPNGMAPNNTPGTPGAPRNTTPSTPRTMPGTPGTPNQGLPRVTTPDTPNNTAPGTPRTTMPSTPNNTTPGAMPPYIYGTQPNDNGNPPTNNLNKVPGMPTTPGTVPNGSMTRPGMPTTPGTAPNNTMNLPYMNNYPTPYGTPQTPNMSCPGYQGVPSNMYIPNETPYNTPMGVPLLPLYGYDNSADLDRDVEYMKQLYPNTAKSIQSEVDNECDRLEYEGSSMFDEYPDRVFIDKIIDRIYDKVRDTEEEPQLETHSIYGGYYPRRRRNYLRDIISIILLNEIFNRRRRYRSRRRWF